MPAILKSKKFQAALIGLLVAFFQPLIPGLEAAPLEMVLAPIVAYIVGQGLADFGKEASHGQG